jgi:hypothetical protein
LGRGCGAGDESRIGTDNIDGDGSDGGGVPEDGCGLDRRRADLDDRDDMEGVRGSDANRLRFVVRLFLKLLGGGLGVSLRFVWDRDREGE